MGSNNKFTEEEIAYINEHFAEQTYDELAANLGRSVSGLKKLAKNLGLSRHYKVWTPEEDEIIRNAKGMSQSEVAKIIGCNGVDIANRIKSLGYSSWYEIKGSKANSEYERVFKDGRIRPKHRVVVEEHIGRKLESNECIHHINFEKKDNRIENLHVFNDRAAHRRAHMSIETIGKQLYDHGLIGFDRDEGVYELTDKALGILRNDKAVRSHEEGLYAVH